MWFNSLLVVRSAFIALWLPLLVLSSAKSATIERYDDPITGCRLLLSGQIEEGDSKRLEAAFRAVESETNRLPERLCLNSPGGSFLEGIELVNVIRANFYRGTAIGQGHVCESACAIVFMAGGLTEGGYSTVKPIMHPEGKLGFHAPGLTIPNGMYGEDTVQEAYKIALVASAKLVELSSQDYRFPELLFYHMLNTPPDDMFYIDTVGKAIAFDISVFPVGIDSSSPMDSLERLCAYNFNYKASVNDFDQVAVNGTVPVTELFGEELTAFFQDGFGEEAVGSCKVRISLKKIMDVEEYLTGPPIDVEFSGIPSKGAYPIASFAPTTKLSELPTDVVESWNVFQDSIGMQESTDVQFCLIENSAGLARVVNVESYANMRSRPDFESRVVRELPLGEQIRLVENNLLLTGAAAQQQFCERNCRAFFRNPDDQNAREGSQQCIRDHMLWYEITDSGGNRGWISRNFLRVVE